MAKPPSEQMTLPSHGAAVLPDVVVDAYNAEIEDKDGFVGDKASKGAFWDILERWRKLLKSDDLDPLGDTPNGKLGKKKLESLLAEGSSLEAGLVQSAVEEFAQQLAAVTRRFLRLKEWREVERIAIGGGFQASRIGKVAVGRAGLILKQEGVDVDFDVIHNDPDHAGLIGAAFLLAPWMLKGHKAILAVDIGGTNIRAGIVKLDLKKSSHLDAAEVVELEHWRHSDDAAKREDVLERLVAMLDELKSHAERDDRRLAPIIGIGCPGRIEQDGSIAGGSQNLPGNWESSTFNLPMAIRERIKTIGSHETLVVMHNDAVVQGLSEIPHCRDCRKWGVLTIGTGLGNAVFSNRVADRAPGPKSAKRMATASRGALR